MVTSEARRIGTARPARTIGNIPVVRIPVQAVAGAASPLSQLVRIPDLPNANPLRGRRRFGQRHLLTSKLRKPRHPNNRLCLLA